MTLSITLSLYREVVRMLGSMAGIRSGLCLSLLGLVVCVPLSLCQSSASVVDALLEALVSDTRLDILSGAFVEGSAFIEPSLPKPTLTVISPTDRAFTIALEQQRLACSNDVPCASIAQYFDPRHLEMNLLRHVFPGNISLDRLRDQEHLMSVNGFSIQVEHMQGLGFVLGGASPVRSDSEIYFEFGKVIVVDDVLLDDAAISATTVRAGEQLLDLAPFDAQKRRAIADSVTRNIHDFRKIRSVFLDSEPTHTSLIFRPLNPFSDLHLKHLPCDDNRVPGINQVREKDNFVSSFEDSELMWNIPKNVIRPDYEEDLAFLSMLELASLLRQGLTTSVELTRLYLSRLKKADPYLEAVVTYTDDLALNQARLADREMQAGIFRSPLHGIPYGLKDLMAVPGYPTTWGAEFFKNQTFDEGCWVYHQMTRAGAVLIAKLATGGLALGDIWFGGRTRNPWNIKQSSCGSSSGSGAATVAGLVPFALGTETLGSLSCPASRMGVTAVRPTFGSVGRTGTMSLSWSLDKTGTFCRFALDCTVVLDGLRGIDPDDTSSVFAPLIDPLSIEPSDMTIAYTDNTDPEVVQQFEEMGVQTKRIDLDFDFPLREMARVILGSEAAASFGSAIRADNSNKDSPGYSWPLFIQSSLFIPAAEYLQANHVREQLIKKGTKLLDRFDAVLVPSNGDGNQEDFGNLIGIPEVVFVVGYHNIRGRKNSPRKIPITQALIGSPFSDGKLLGIVARYQEATTHHLKRPPVDRVEKRAREFCLPFSRCSYNSQ